MSEQENVAVVRRAYENFKGGDIRGILDSLTDEVDWRLPDIEHVPFAGGRKGRERVGNFFSELADAQEVISFEPREFVAQGDKVVALGSERGRVRATGKTFDNPWALVFTLRDGLITEFRGYEDTGAVAAAFRAD